MLTEALTVSQLTRIFCSYYVGLFVIFFLVPLALLVSVVFKKTNLQRPGRVIIHFSLMADN